MEKRYKEALERARKGMSIDEIFPELKESEDERIRKELIEYLTHKAEVTGFVDEDRDCKRWIAYLEKQKDEVQKQFNLGMQAGREEVMYEMEKEQKPVEWTPTKEQMVALNWAANGVDNKSPVAGDIKASLRSLYNDIQSKSIKPAEWSEEDEEIREEVIGDLCALKDWIIKYDANWLANPVLKNIDKRISWLKSFRPQPHTVSIKDATKFGNLEYERGVKDGIQSEKSRHWKPNEKQINMLKAIVEREKEKPLYGIDGYSPAAVLESLHTELQKLL